MGSSHLSLGFRTSHSKPLASRERALASNLENKEVHPQGLGESHQVEDHELFEIRFINRI